MGKPVMCRCDGCGKTGKADDGDVARHEYKTTGTPCKGTWRSVITSVEVVDPRHLREAYEARWQQGVAALACRGIRITEEAAAAPDPYVLLEHATVALQRTQEDLRAALVRYGDAAGERDRYKREIAVATTELEFAKGEVRRHDPRLAKARWGL